MVIRLLRGGIGGDLDTEADNFGVGDDLVYVEDGFNYLIVTLGGADRIELFDAGSAGTRTVFAGSGNDTVIGSAGQDAYTDHSGNDLVRLAGGNDFAEAGVGRDTLDGGSGTDTVSFDRLYNGERNFFNGAVEAVVFDLAIRGKQNLGAFGIDRITGFENVRGGSGDDRFYGNDGANELNGGNGNDRLFGRGGMDILIGSRGADTIVGGTGGDRIDLSSEILPGRDIVRYISMTDSGTGLGRATVDRITGFSFGDQAIDDLIDLSAIDARPGTRRDDAFIFRGDGEFRSARGEVRVVSTGSDCLVQVDIDGDGASEMNILVLGMDAMTAADFIL